MNNTTLLLQSGGRDSSAAAVLLLEEGQHVVGLTLSRDAANLFEVPRKRAVELSEKYPNYSWGMVDFTSWDQLLNDAVSPQLSTRLPKSCLLCALSKITAVIPFCLERGIKRIALGYTEYQSDWAEQTPLAIQLQKDYLLKLGIELLLPVKNYSSKGAVEATLIAKDLTPESLENPCCISAWGTQDVDSELITEAVGLAFDFYDNNSRELGIEIVNSIGTGVNRS